MDTLKSLLGNRIRELREAKGLKQVALAEMIDIEATNLSKIEKGIHFPKDETLDKIIKALGVNLNELFSFVHIQPRQELIKNIEKILKESNDYEIQFFYKFLVSYKELH